MLDRLLLDLEKNAVTVSRDSLIFHHASLQHLSLNCITENIFKMVGLAGRNITKSHHAVSAVTAEAVSPSSHKQQCGIEDLMASL